MTSASSSISVKIVCKAPQKHHNLYTFTNQTILKLSQVTLQLQPPDQISLSDLYQDQSSKNLNVNLSRKNIIVQQPVKIDCQKLYPMVKLNYQCFLFIRKCDVNLLQEQLVKSMGISVLRVPTKKKQQQFSSYTEDIFVHCGTYNNYHQSAIKITKQNKLYVQIKDELNKAGKWIQKSFDGKINVIKNRYQWANNDMFHFWKNEQALQFQNLLLQQEYLDQINPTKPQKIDSEKKIETGQRTRFTQEGQRIEKLSQLNKLKYFQPQILCFPAEAKQINIPKPIIEEINIDQYEFIEENHNEADQVLSEQQSNSQVNQSLQIINDQQREKPYQMQRPSEYPKKIHQILRKKNKRLTSLGMARITPPVFLQRQAKGIDVDEKNQQKDLKITKVGYRNPQTISTILQPLYEEIQQRQKDKEEEENNKKSQSQPLQEQIQQSELKQNSQLQQQSRKEQNFKRKKKRKLISKSNTSQHKYWLRSSESQYKTRIQKKRIQQQLKRKKQMLAQSAFLSHNKKHRFHVPSSRKRHQRTYIKQNVKKPIHYNFAIVGHSQKDNLYYKIYDSNLYTFKHPSHTLFEALNLNMESQYSLTYHNGELIYPTILAVNPQQNSNILINSSLAAQMYSYDLEKMSIDLTITNKDYINDIRFSERSATNFFAIANSVILCGDLRVQAAESLRQYSIDNRFNHLQLHQNNLFVSSQSGKIRIFDIRKIAQSLNVYSFDPYMKGMAYYPNFNKILVTYDSKICWKEIKNEQLEKRIRHKNRQCINTIELPLQTRNKIIQNSQKGFLPAKIDPSGEQLMTGLGNVLIRWQLNENFKCQINEMGQQLNFVDYQKNGIIISYEKNQESYFQMIKID